MGNVIQQTKKSRLTERRIDMKVMLQELCSSKSLDSALALSVTQR